MKIVAKSFFYPLPESIFTEEAVLLEIYTVKGKHGELYTSARCCRVPNACVSTNMLLSIFGYQPNHHNPAKDYYDCIIKESGIKRITEDVILKQFNAGMLELDNQLNKALVFYKKFQNK